MKYYVGGLYFDSEDSLVHHGIKGQKWGVRRFQNEDGSLTSEGRRHRVSTGEAKEALGIQKKRLDSYEREYVDRYKHAQNKINKYNLKAEKAKSKGKDPSKYINKAKHFMSDVDIVKAQSKRYSELSNRQKRTLRGTRFASQMSFSKIYRADTEAERHDASVHYAYSNRNYYKQRAKYGV